MFEKIKYFLEKLFNLNKFKLPQGISLDERTSLINAQKNQILNGLNLDKKSDSEILKEFKQQGLSQQQAEKKLDVIRKDIERIFDITPINEFGKNYAEYYNDGKNAIQKLLSEKQGQVAGAFYKEGLGEIDLVWGTFQKNNEKGYGLEKIIKKHLKNGDFEIFGSGEYGLIIGLNEIIDKGRVVDKNCIYTIWHKKDNIYYKLGLSQGFYGVGKNQWIVTAYETTREKDKTFGDALFADKRPLSNLDNNNPTIKKQISQDAKILTPDGCSYALGCSPSVKLDRPSHLNNNPTTKIQTSQEQKKQAHLAREAGIKKSLDLLQKQSKLADTAVSNISSHSVKNETKPKFRKMFQKKDNINNKDKK